ncbi:MAG: ABC transporter permease [Polyangiaceae bacterium]
MRTWAIFKRELRANFDSPAPYVVICLTMMLLGYWVFHGSDTFGQPSFWAAGQASFETMFRGLPWAVMLVTSILTMRVFSEEKRSGTLELLITLPVKDWEVVVGKFFGTFMVVVILLATTLLYPVLMFKFWDFGALDAGPVIAGYLGLIFYAAAATAIGLMISSLFESQMITLFVTLAILAGFNIIGLAGGLSEQEWLKTVLNFVSFDARLAPFAKGLVTTRDLIFFATITIGALMVSFRALERRKWA